MQVEESKLGGISKIWSIIMKVFFLIIGILIIIIALYLLYFSKQIPDYKPIVKILKIHSDDLNESIYIKKKSWGITYDHQLIIISKSSDEDFEPNEDENYIFLNLFYKVKEDTVFIYTMKKSTVPRNFHSKFKIKQIELSNPEMMELTTKYKEKGLDTL